MGRNRQDTRLEAEGAEFLVCAHLLIDGIPAYKTYTQMPGYDIVAVNPERGTSAKIQVKSRRASDSDQGFPLKNLDTDFVVFVLLNRGNRFGKREIAKQSPEMFVFPIDVAKSARSETGWNKVMTRKIPDRENYRENWELVRSFLEEAPSP
ncbi:MAG: hypothetical protein R3D60_13400 [Paracoccaceae bacterium]